MKIFEIASADEQIGLWRLITNSVWSSLDQQAREQAEQKALQKQRSSRAKRRKRGTKVARPKPRPPIAASTSDKNTAQSTNADDNSADSNPSTTSQNSTAQQQLQNPATSAQPVMRPATLNTAITAVGTPSASAPKNVIAQPAAIKPMLPSENQIPRPHWPSAKQN